MGACCSKSSGIAQAEDSLHVMITHDKKAAIKRGEKSPEVGYVPRAEHPALAKAREEQKQRPVVAVEEDDVGLSIDDEQEEVQQDPSAS